MSVSFNSALQHAFVSGPFSASASGASPPQALLAACNTRLSQPLSTASGASPSPPVGRRGRALGGGGGGDARDAAGGGGGAKGRLNFLYVEALALTRDARTQRGGSKPVIRFVPSKVQAHTTLSRDLATSLAGLGEAVLPAIGQRVAVAEAALHGLTVREHVPNSVAHTEFMALAHAVEEILPR